MCVCVRERERKKKPCFLIQNICCCIHILTYTFLYTHTHIHTYMHAYIYAFILQSMPNSEEHHNEEHGPPRPPPGHQETGIARRPPMRDSQADHKGFPVQETLSPNYWRIQRLIDHSSPNLLAGCSHTGEIQEHGQKYFLQVLAGFRDVDAKRRPICGKIRRGFSADNVRRSPKTMHRGECASRLP